MLEILSIIDNEWYQVTGMDENFVSYETPKKTGKVKMSEAVLRFKNDDGSWHTLPKII